MNPYFDSSIQQSPRQLPTPGLSGIDSNSIYGSSSPGYGVSMNNSYFDPTILGGFQDTSSHSWHPKAATTGPDYGSAAAGIASLGLNAYAASQQGLHLNQQIAPSQYDQDSAPSYTAGALQSQAVNSRPKGVSGGEVLGGAAQGAAIGTQFMPGIGTAIGAVGGAAIAAIGGAIRGNKQRAERQAALQKVIGAQQGYNTQDVAFRNQQNQREQYLRRMNPYNREYAVNQTRFYNG